MGEVLHINLDDDDEKKPSRHRSKKPEAKEAAEEEKKKKGTIESKKDLEDLFRTMTQEMKEYIKNMDLWGEGIGYELAWDAREGFTQFLMAGPHIEVYNEYRYLADPAKQAEFLKSDSSQLDYSTRASLVHFVMMMRKSEEARDDVRRFMDNKIKPGAMRCVYSIIRLEQQAKSLFDERNWSFLLEVYMRFYYLYDMFNGRKFSSLNIDEMTVGEDEAYEQVAKIMNKFIRNSPSLRDALNTIDDVAMDVYNYCLLYDKMTKQIAECLVFTESYHETSEAGFKLAKVFADMANEGYDSDIPWNQFCGQINEAVQCMESVFDIAWRISRDFENKEKDPPYCIMHPGTEMDNAAYNSGIGYVDLGIHNGTRYAEAIRAMPSVATKIARKIAKTAFE